MDGRSYVWTFVGYYSVNYSAQNTQQDPTQQVPQIYWVLFWDTNRINTKYQIHLYPTYAHSSAPTDGRTDTGMYDGG